MRLYKVTGIDEREWNTQKVRSERNYFLSCSLVVGEKKMIAVYFALRFSCIRKIIISCFCQLQTFFFPRRSVRLLLVLLNEDQSHLKRTQCLAEIDATISRYSWARCFHLCGFSRSLSPIAPFGYCSCERVNEILCSLVLWIFGQAQNIIKTKTFTTKNELSKDTKKGAHRSAIALCKKCIRKISSGREVRSNISETGRREQVKNE